MSNIEDERDPSDNLKIWDALKDTDPKTTKKVDGKGFNMTAINPNSVYHKLTELFGPCGIGWGYQIEKESYSRGHGDGVNCCIVHVVQIGFWYRPETQYERSELIPSLGQTDFVSKVNKWVDGKQVPTWVTDEEAPKKSLTDALTNAASKIGVSADIYGGGWDSNKYTAAQESLGSSPQKIVSEAEKILGAKGPQKKPGPTTAKPISPGDGGAPISKPQIKRLIAIMLTAGKTKEQVMAYVKAHYGYDKMEEIGWKHYSDICAHIESEEPYVETPEQREAAEEGDVPF